jgi:16S rRNA (uracil1498-N3)-methyltransferase
MNSSAPCLFIVHPSSFIVRMRHRIFVEAIEPQVTVTGEEFHHSIRVVRARAGEEVELFDRTGNAARGVVETIERDRAVIRTGEALPSRESSLAIHLAMAVIQLEKFELVLQKGTELGVKTFIPLVTERVELRPERYSGKMDRWEKIVFEAVKQCGRTQIPKIEAPATFDQILTRSGTKVLFDADAEPPTANRQPPTDLTLLIGPEGGWTEDELRAAREHGVHFERLGPRRLRAETAAIAAVSVVASRFGDL